MEIWFIQEIYCVLKEILRYFLKEYNLIHSKIAESTFSSDLVSIETYSVAKELNWNKIWPSGWK